MSERFVVVNRDEAVANGWLDAECANDFGWYVYEVVPGVDKAMLIGQDGGEPEDQLLVRDWDWVAPALNNAYARAIEDAAKICDQMAHDCKVVINAVPGTDTEIHAAAQLRASMRIAADIRALIKVTK